MLMSFTAYGHSNHKHKKHRDPCKKHITKDLQSSGFKIGKCHIGVLIKKKKIDDSWSEAKELQVVKAKNKKDWKVTFENSKVEKNKILYIFLNSKGRYLAANFKGE